MKILVVDDEDAIRQLCEKALKRDGHEVAIAASGDEAAGRLNEGWDIILTDLTMPGSVNGLNLVKRTRTASSADVIIMTAYPELESAVSAIREGAYDYLIKPFTLEILAMAIRRCATKRELSKELSAEKELRRVYEIFGRFATPQVAQEVLAHPQDYWKRGDRCDISVLFADVRSFTPFASEVAPEQALAFLNDIFSHIVDAVQSEGGVINKFIGDGLMAVFGAPIRKADHWRSAARAAIKARSALENLAEVHRIQNLPVLRVGFGINSGEVLAGCLGVRERSEYTVIGHAVNVASRIESIAAPGQILVGPETASRLRPDFRLKELGSKTLQGLKDPLDLFELVESPV